MFRRHGLQVALRCYHQMSTDNSATTSGEAGSPAHPPHLTARMVSEQADYVVEITNESDRFIDCRRLRALLISVLRQEACPAGYEISVRLAGDNVMADLHERWMGISGPTDVLSFPQDDPCQPATGAPTLGDVILSVDTAERQAREHGLHLEEETMLLAVHGTLHLLGYDDLDEAAFAEMRAREMMYVPEAFAAAEGGE